MPGDIVRKSSGGQAGIIKSIEKQLSLSGTLTGEPLGGWFNADSVIGYELILLGDHVIYGDWVGIVEDCMKFGRIRTRSGDGTLGLMSIADVSSISPYLTVGAPATVRSSRSI
jgi:hypothetical protein